MNEELRKKIEELIVFLKMEIAERRDYSASKAFEIVIEKLLPLTLLPKGERLYTEEELNKAFEKGQDYEINSHSSVIHAMDFDEFISSLRSSQPKKD